MSLKEHIGFGYMLKAFELRLWKFTGKQDKYYENDKVEVTDLEEADMVSSKIGMSEHHVIMLDIDIPMYVVDSTSPGHRHLYIPGRYDWKLYEELLDVLAKMGILEKNYVEVSKKRKATFLRLPWVKKPLPVAKGPYPE